MSDDSKNGDDLIDKNLGGITAGDLAKTLQEVINYYEGKIELEAIEVTMENGVAKTITDLGKTTMKNGVITPVGEKGITTILPQQKL